jgi:hypothetical protein
MGGDGDERRAETARHDEAVRRDAEAQARRSFGEPGDLRRDTAGPT